MKVFRLFGLIFLLLATGQSIAKADVSFSVNPMKLELNGLPGSSARQAIQVENLSSNKPLVILVKKASFTVNSNDQIIFSKPLKNENSAANWLTFDKSKFVIKPDGSQTVLVQIKVPKDAGFLEHHAAIFFETEPKSQKGQANVKVGGRIATLVIQNSPGHQSFDGKIAYFSVPKFVISWPGQKTINIPFKFAFLNTGNSHFDFNSEVDFTDNFGKNIFSKDYGMQTAVPLVYKHFSGKVTKVPAMGIYKASAKISFANGKIASQDISFYVVSLKTILILLFVLIFLFVFVTLIIKFYLPKQKAS